MIREPELSTDSSGSATAAPAQRLPQRLRRPVLFFLLIGALSGCMMGPDYVRPPTDTAAPFKGVSTVPEGWKQATPADQFPRGHWWEIYNNPELNRLEEQATVANPTIAVAYANYREAQAQVGQARAGLFPALNAGADVTRGKSNTGTQGISGAGVRNNVDVNANATWELDLWGQVRRAVEASEANAAAAGNDFAGAQLSIQAELAVDYFSLRVADSGQRLLDRTVDDYQHALTLTQNRYAAGVAGRTDVVQADAQLKSAQAQAVDNKATRAQFEHAIAVLVGQQPQTFALAVAPDVPPPPDVPPGLPSQLLERRPDIASAERRMAAANAEVGVATAAFYPTLSLSASGGVVGSSLSHLFTLPNTLWAVGASLRNRCLTQDCAKASWSRTLRPTTAPWPRTGRRSWRASRTSRTT